MIEQPAEDEEDEFLQKLIGDVNLELDFSVPIVKTSGASQLSAKVSPDKERSINEEEEKVALP